MTELTVVDLLMELAKWGRLSERDTVCFPQECMHMALDFLQHLWPEVHLGTKVMLTDRAYYVTMEGYGLDNMVATEVYLKPHRLLGFWLRMDYNVRAKVLIILPPKELMEWANKVWRDQTQ